MLQILRLKIIQRNNKYQTMMEQERTTKRRRLAWDVAPSEAEVENALGFNNLNEKAEVTSVGFVKSDVDSE